MKHPKRSTGSIYVVATPIGNLEDITLRALRVLREISVLGCENVGRARKLLQSLQLDTEGKDFLVLNDAREDFATEQFLKILKSGKDVAIVSDSGTPLISDPGFQLICAASGVGIRTVPVPGPSALATLASICPIPLHHYMFLGFLSKKGKKRRDQLLRIKNSSLPAVVFESPHRILQTLQDLIEADMGARNVFLGREMTKDFEEYRLTTLCLLYQDFVKRTQIKGELTIVIAAGCEQNIAWSNNHITRVLSPYLKPGQVATVLAELQGLTRGEAYTTVVNESRRRSQDPDG